jgi:Transglycosylase SLT domain
VYNLFLVLPRGMMDLQNADNYLWKVTPSVIVDHEHPSFVGRYGIRFMKVETPYLSAFPAGAGTEKPTPLSAAQKQDLPPQPAGAAVWADKANTYATLNGVSPEHRPWFVALIQQESSFRPDAVGKSKDGSEDQGIAQFNNVHGPNPASIGLTNPFDPDNALPAAARYWQILRGQVGNDPRLIAAAYNAGAGAVLAAKGIPPQAAQHVRNVEQYVPRHQHYAGTAPVKHGVEVPTPPEGRAGRPETTAAPPPATSEAVDGIVEIAQRWSALLMAWYDMGGELFSGSLTVRGHPAWNIGHRLLYDDPHGAWEAYIEGVQHRYDMRTGQYLTQLRITRGWPLTEAGAAQLWLEALTTVTESTGGPPILDPQTGEPGAGWADKPGSAGSAAQRFSGTPLLRVRPRITTEPPQETP